MTFDKLRPALQQGIYLVLNPFVRLLIKLGFMPNAELLTGLLLTSSMAMLFIVGGEASYRRALRYIGWGGALVLFAMLDGQVARLGKLQSPHGARYDSVLGRYKLFTFLGSCYYLVGLPQRAAQLVARSTKMSKSVSVATLLALSLLAVGLRADAAQPTPILTFPVPSGISNQLFYLQRDPNTNTVIYQLNIGSNGKVDEDEPVRIFWIRYAEQGQQQELSFIQRKFGYGLKFKKLAPDKYELRFAASSKRPLYLMKGGPDRAFHVYMSISNQLSVLERIYLRIEGGTFWVPNVKYIELKGWLPSTHAPTVEHLNV